MLTTRVPVSDLAFFYFCIVCTLSRGTELCYPHKTMEMYYLYIDT